MDYKNLFLGIISLVAGILILVNLKKSLDEENLNSLSLPDKFRKIRGFLASLCLVIMGFIMIYREIIIVF